MYKETDSEFLSSWVSFQRRFIATRCWEGMVEYTWVYLLTVIITYNFSTSLYADDMYK